MKTLLKKNYNLEVTKTEKSAVGAGSDTYFVTCDSGKYVVKFPSVSEINNPEAESKFCEFLLEKGISVCKFIKNNCGEYITTDDSGRMFHVQEFVDGTMYDWNSAPDWLLKESAKTLGRIHASLQNYVGLPTGIGENFFKYMTPENALRSYERSIEIARKNGDTKIEKDLLYRIELVNNFSEYNFDLSKLTCGATHGDFFISQLICGEDKINAVIDWTTACVHPLVWEIMRSYVYAAPECANGEIDTCKLRKYFEDYCRYAELNNYDLENAAKLFYYQIAVCDYYNQYYTSKADNREIYLRQAVFSTGLLKWFEKHAEKVGCFLQKYS